MSMILDALSRAEKERQAESFIDHDSARYVTSSTIKEDRFKRWVLLALLANFALLILLVGGYLWKNHSTGGAVAEVIPEASVEPVVVDSPPAVVVAPEVAPELPLETPLVAEQQSAQPSVALTASVKASAPAASLLDEAKVKKSAPVTSVKRTVKKPSPKKTVKKTPPVQYSSQPLTHKPVSQRPDVASITQAIAREKQANTGAYTSLSDLPSAQRAQLGRYEVNVHVYDDNPQSRFVLINMVKYKEGDQLSGGQASVAAIVPQGVVINHNNQQVLIERNQ